MNLKNWLDSHPLKIIGGIVLSCVVLTAAFVDYLKNIQLEVSQEKLITTYENKISNIRLNYDYIVRSISEDLKIFSLDKLIISESQLSRFGKEYIMLGNKDFLIQKTSSEGWDYEFIPSSDLSRYAYDFSPQLDHTKKIHFWINDNTKKICFPQSIYDHKCNARYIKFSSQAYVHVIKYEDELELLDQLADDGYISEYYSPTKSECLSLPPLACFDALTGFQDHIKMKYADDMSIEIMLYHLFASSAVEDYGMWTIDVYSIECKENLCYFSYRMNYPPGFDESGNKVSIYVDREIYLIDFESRLFMINTIIVNDGDTSNDYEWIDDWLAGIRVID